MYNIDIYSEKRVYKTLSNNPANNNPYANEIAGFSIYSGLIIESDKVLKMQYKTLGEFNYSQAVGIKLYNIDTKQTIYYDVINATIERGLLTFNVKRNIWADVGTYNQLCVADNSYINFERANYFPADLSGTKYLKASQNNLENIQYNSIEIKEFGQHQSTSVAYVVQFCVRNADSTFEDQKYNNYIKTYVFDRPYVYYGGTDGTITQDLNAIQKITSYYGTYKNPLDNPNKVEALNIYVVPLEFIENFIYMDNTTASQYKFKTTDDKYIAGYGLNLYNIQAVDYQTLYIETNLTSYLISNNGTSNNDETIEYKVENNATYKYFVGTLGNLVEFNQSYSYNADVSIYRKVSLTSDLFKVSLIINGNEIDFTDEFSASTTSNSAEALETQKLSRTLGFVGNTINSIVKIAMGNIGSGFTSAEQLLNYNNPLYQGSVSPRGNYSETYGEFNVDGVNINQYIYEPFKFVRFKTSETNDNINYNGLPVNGCGVLYSSSSSTIPSKMRLIPKDLILYTKGDLIVKNQVVNDDILQEIKQELKNGLHYYVL